MSNHEKGVKGMENLLVIIIGFVLAGILWRITKFVAKLVTVAVIAWALYATFIGTNADAKMMAEITPMSQTFLTL